MSLITLVIVIILVGLLLWAVERFIPMDQTIKRILQAVVVIVLILWILKAFGILGHINDVRI